MSMNYFMMGPPSGSESMHIRGRCSTSKGVYLKDTVVCSVA